MRFGFLRIETITKFEEHKLQNPFHNLKIFSPYSDFFCLIFLIFSFIYYLMESRNDKEWNYFRIIDYFLQLTIFILSVIRYTFFVKVKKYYRNN